MNPVTMSATATLIEAAEHVLRGVQQWPDTSTGFAYRIGEKVPLMSFSFAGQPLRDTDALRLRRTPEISAFGFVVGRASAATRELWLEAIDHLRGREIYPSDRQSFVFNPAEVLGIASGLAELAEDDDRRRWLVDALRRGFATRQFRGGISEFGAHVALTLLDKKAAQEYPPERIDLSATPEFFLLAGIVLAFADFCPISIPDVIDAFESRILTQQIVLTDAADAAGALILSYRVRDRALAPASPISELEKVVALCRRFPLFADTLRTRQRGRIPYGINDEYDVQDLLHAILRLHFDDVRPEEHTPSYASSHSRVDFYLPGQRMVIEAKMTRKKLAQKEVIDELIIDATRYTNVSGVDTLVCIVYDPERICTNPKAIESDVETSGSKLKVRVVVCPQGL